PVQTPFGYHVIQRQPPAELTEVRGGIEATLGEQLQDQAFTEWLTDLRAQADVDVDPDIGRWDAPTGTVLP
ncbi:MAG: peptidylprolyl isomerase, partial [Pseudonocardiaceae bacterium]